MNLQNISIEQLKQAIAIKENLATLEQKLAKLTAGKAIPTLQAPAKNARKGISKAGRARIAAAQKARWAKVKSSAAAPAAKPAGKKRKLSPEGRARIVAALKKRWASKKKA